MELTLVDRLERAAAGHPHRLALKSGQRAVTDLPAAPGGLAACRQGPQKGVSRCQRASYPAGRSPGNGPHDLCLRSRRRAGCTTRARSPSRRSRIAPVVCQRACGSDRAAPSVACSSTCAGTGCPPATNPKPSRPGAGTGPGQARYACAFGPHIWQHRQPQAGPVLPRRAGQLAPYGHSRGHIPGQCGAAPDPGRVCFGILLFVRRPGRARHSHTPQRRRRGAGAFGDHPGRKARMDLRAAPRPALAGGGWAPPGGQYPVRFVLAGGGRSRPAAGPKWSSPLPLPRFTTYMVPPRYRG